MNRVEFLDGRDGVCVIASCREALLQAAPEFTDVILRDIATYEKDLPCWLAAVAGKPHLIGASTNALAGADGRFPKWWNALARKDV